MLLFNKLKGKKSFKMTGNKRLYRATSKILTVNLNLAKNKLILKERIKLNPSFWSRFKVNQTLTAI